MVISSDGRALNYKQCTVLVFLNMKITSNDIRAKGIKEILNDIRIIPFDLGAKL